MSDLCTTSGVFRTVVLTLFMGSGAVFTFNAGCAGETPAEEPALQVPDAPEPPDKQTPVDTECD
ncbi:MAG: hypothetical protein VX699_12155, partial [Myxococcota bacterium]|nr:hypothetical protein [Myxococcota bacterium]